MRYKLLIIILLINTFIYCDENNKKIFTLDECIESVTLTSGGQPVVTTEPITIPIIIPGISLPMPSILSLISQLLMD